MLSSRPHPQLLTSDDESEYQNNSELFFDLDAESSDGETHIIIDKKKKKKKKKQQSTNPDDIATGSYYDQDSILLWNKLDAWLAKGAHLSRRKAQHTLMLLDAAAVGHVEAAKILLKKQGIRVLKQDDSYNYTPLHFAANNGHADIVRLLLDHPQIQIDRGRQSSLFLACNSGNTDIVKILVDAKADINKPDANGNTPLHVAYLRENMQAVEILLSAGATMDNANDHEVSCTESL